MHKIYVHTSLFYHLLPPDAHKFYKVQTYKTYAHMDLQTKHGAIYMSSHSIS